MIVNSKSDDTLTGVLWQTRGPWYVLRTAALLKAGSKPTPIDGDVVIHRDNISFLQMLP